MKGNDEQKDCDAPDFQTSVPALKISISSNDPSSNSKLYLWLEI